MIRKTRKKDFYIKEKDKITERCTEFFQYLYSSSAQKLKIETKTALKAFFYATLQFLLTFGVLFPHVKLGMFIVFVL